MQMVQSALMKCDYDFGANKYFQVPLILYESLRLSRKKCYYPVLKCLQRKCILLFGFEAF